MAPALLVVDVQNGIDESKHWGGNRNNPEAEGNIKKLLEFWRAQRFSVVIVAHDSVEPQSPFRPGQRGNELKDFVSVRAGEAIIRKSTPSAFVNTGLDGVLKEMNVDQLFITGFVTNNSVESTARMAGALGFRATVVSDATATFNKTGIDGTIYSSELVHQISLANISGEYAEVKTTASVIEDLKKRLNLS